jgi:hypothetical protein
MSRRRPSFSRAFCAGDLAGALSGLACGAACSLPRPRAGRFYGWKHQVATWDNCAFMNKHFTLGDFDFTLPEELIAQHPAAQRSASRLLDGRDSLPVDRRFTELPGLLLSGDLLVFNDTKVVKARLFGQKASGGKLELLIERVLSPACGRRP